MDQTDQIADQVNDGLTHRQRRFVDLFILYNMNATKAAIALGCENGPGIRVQAHRLLHHEGVQTEIDRRLKDEHMDAIELLRIIARDARGLFGEYIDHDGKLDLHSMKEDRVTHLIDQIVPTKYGTSYKGPSRQRAQEMYIKILGLQRIQYEISGSDGGLIQIELSSEEEVLRLQALLTLQQATKKKN